MTVDIPRGIFLIEKKIQTKDNVPNKPLKISSGLFFPQGLIFFKLIMDNVIIRLIIDLKKTNS